MYDLLDIKKEPFSTSPDPNFFYFTREHKSALFKIILEVLLKRGLSVVLGDVGIGKTTLCRKLIQFLSERKEIETYVILDPDYDNEHMFISDLIKTFGISLKPKKYIRRPAGNIYKEALMNFLFKKTVEEKKTIVLLVDEAQKISVEALEVLRMLLNYETNEFKMLQLVLFGQLELKNQLAQMPNLIDRITLKLHLEPLCYEELRDLIYFRLKTSGYNEYSDLFTEEAMKMVYTHAKGMPRKATMLCHNALRELLVTNSNKITEDIVSNLVRHEPSIW